ncbi:MAG: hypothetical protein J5I93_07575 [Pirellulaceae bacterium]|nr:hypothetical protein [Pirellulaceae bacterium]
MNYRLINRFLASAALAAVALLVVPRPASAQQAAGDTKPVAVLSVASINEITKDISFLSKAADVADLGGIANLMIIGFTQGVDTSRPAGMYIVMEGAAPKGVGFVPVTDFATVRRQIEEGLNTELQDAGNGVLRLAQEDRDVYVKPQDGWMFVSDRAENLGGVPKDPTVVLDGLHQTYDVALRINARNVPAEIRDMLVTQMKAGFARGFEQGLDEDQPNRELTEELGRNMIQSYVSLIEETDQLTLGWAIDNEAKATYVDVKLTAVAGTELAQQMALLKNLRSNFRGFELPNAAATLSLSSKMRAAEIQQTLAMLKGLREQAMEQLDQNTDIPDETTRQAIKDAYGTAMDVVEKTVADGKVDGGAAVLLGSGKVRFVAGGGVADGPALERAFRKLVDVAKNEPEFPQVNFNVDKYQQVTFHTMSVAVPENEAEARKVLGEKLDMALGVGAHSFYVAFGENSVGLVKQVIDGSASQADADAAPMKLSIALAPLLQFAKAMDENALIGALADAISNAAGRDHILVTAQPIERGVNYRLNVEDGVLKLIGQGIKLMTGAQQQFGNDF